MQTYRDTRRILIFLAFAFGIAWLTGLVIYLTGGLVNSPLLAPGISLALVLLASFYMWAPALANILTRLITREGWANAGLRPYFRLGWPYWVYGWVLPAVATILGAALFFVLYPQYYGGAAAIAAQYQNQGLPVPANVWSVVITQTLVAILIAPILNALATFGEEFGWRAYLLPKLLAYGPRTAMLLQGVIWGVWHWPVIWMGYEYGFDYFGFPWVGMLLFLVFTFSAGVFLAWITLRGRSVWPAVIGHAAINGIAGISVPFLAANPPTLLGPLPVGLIGVAGYLLLAIILYASTFALTPQAPNSLPLPWKDEERLEIPA